MGYSLAPGLLLKSNMGWSIGVCNSTASLSDLIIKSLHTATISLFAYNVSKSMANYSLMILLLLVRLASWYIFLYVEISSGGALSWRFIIAVSRTKTSSRVLTHHRSHFFQSDPLI